MVAALSHNRGDVAYTEHMGLTLKQERFCQAYVANGGNATEAYRTAYDCSTMTDKSVNEVAARLPKEVKIASRVKELEAWALEAAGVTPERIVRQYAKWAFGDKRDLVAKGAADSLAKIAGLFTDKVQVTGKDGGPVQTERVEALARLGPDRLAQIEAWLSE